MASAKKIMDKELSKKILVKVTLNGPYVVSGNVPLTKMVIETDEEGYPYTWQETETYSPSSAYSLCRARANALAIEFARAPCHILIIDLHARA